MHDVNQHTNSVKAAVAGNKNNVGKKNNASNNTKNNASTNKKNNASNNKKNNASNNKKHNARNNKKNNASNNRNNKRSNIERQTEQLRNRLELIKLRTPLDSDRRYLLTLARSARKVFGKDSKQFKNIGEVYRQKLHELEVYKHVKNEAIPQSPISKSPKIPAIHSKKGWF